MKILFAGTPDIAVPSLRFLAQSGHTVALLTQPDQPGKRGRDLVAPPTKVFAGEQGLKVYQPNVLNTQFRRELENWGPDLLISFAFGKIFGPLFLALFPKGGWNLHPSLLPRFRGPSPLSAVLLAGDEQTGITLQTLAHEMDSGDILLQIIKKLDGHETTQKLSDWAAQEGAALLQRALTKLEEGELISEPQKGEPSYCSLTTSSQARIDWNNPSHILDRQIRAYNPWPGARTQWKNQELLIWSASPWTGILPSESLLIDSKPGLVLGVDKTGGILVQTGEGILAIRTLQLAGKKVLDHRSFLNGAPDLVGSQWGSDPEKST